MPVLAEELTRLERHKWQISSISFSPDGSRLATGSWDKDALVWDLGSLEPVVTLTGLHVNPVTSLAWFNIESTLIATGSADTSIGLWNAVTGENLLVLRECFGWVLGTCFSSDGSFLGAASWDKIVRLWEPNTGSLLNTLHGHKGGVWSLDFHSERNVLCSGSADGTVRMWDARSNKCAAVYGEDTHTAAVHCVKWSPDNTNIASGSADAKITIWDVRKQEPVNVLSGHNATVKSIVYNKNTHNVAIPVLASGGDSSVKIWDPRPSARGQSLMSVSLHQRGKEVEVVDISPDGSLLASGGRDGVTILMTLFVPTILPRTDSGVKREFHKKTIRSSYLLARQESFKKSDEAELTDYALDQMLTDPKVPNTTQLKRVHSRLKRRTRTSEKDFELDQEPAVVLKTNMRKSRMNRAKEKDIDLPDMIVHLAAKVNSYKPEIFSESDSDDEPQTTGAGQLLTDMPDTKGKVTAAMHSFQAERHATGTDLDGHLPRDNSMDFDNESMLSANYRLPDLDSSIASGFSPSPHPFSDSDASESLSPPAGYANSSTPRFKFDQDNAWIKKNPPLHEEAEAELREEQDSENDEVPYSVI